MKKTTRTTAIVFLSSVTFIVGCKKEKEIPTSQDSIKNEVIYNEGDYSDKGGNAIQFDQEFQVGNEGRFLVFKSEKGYNKVVENPSDEVRQNIIARMNAISHTSWRVFTTNDGNVSNDELIDDEYFSSILSKDRTIQIENHIFRILPEINEVLAIHVKDKNLYPDLISDHPNHEGIMHFSLDDNVLELIRASNQGGQGIGNANDVSPAWSWGCNEDCCGFRREDTETTLIPVIGGTHNFKGFVRYLKLGIYFSLSAHASSSTSAVRIYIQAENIWYHQKCGYTNGPYSFPWYQNNSTYSTNQKYQSYSGSKCLNGLHFKMRVRCEVSGYPQGGNPYTTYFTNWVRICVNSSFC